MNSVKALSESPALNSIPSIYTYFKNNESPASDLQDSIPVIDFSLLTFGDHDLRSQAVQELDKACKDWGFFQVINHGVPETLMNLVIEKTNDFFNMSDEEKKDFIEKDVNDPLRYGTSLNLKKDKILFWRDFLRLRVHPVFHSPNKPLGLSEVIFEYSKRIREVANGLINGISTGLGLDPYHIEQAMGLESSLQVFIANLYPPCPQPKLAMGFPPHSDHGLLTLLIDNGVGGLQIKHNGKWVNVKNTIPNSYLVNIADHLEIFSNGKYKSVEHRAVPNNAATRISVVITNGPSLDTVVQPARELVDEERFPAAYSPMTYKEYLEMQQNSGNIEGKNGLDRVRV